MPDIIIIEEFSQEIFLTKINNKIDTHDIVSVGSDNLRVIHSEAITTGSVYNADVRWWAILKKKGA